MNQCNKTDTHSMNTTIINRGRGRADTSNVRNLIALQLDTSSWTVQRCLEEQLKKQ